MSWSEFRARRQVLEDVLSRAETDPMVVRRLADVPGARRHFSSPDEILLALQHRWSEHLAALLDQAVEDGTAPRDAWLHLAAEQPALRAALDAGAEVSAALRRQQAGEQAMADAHLTGRATAAVRA
ncbi:hypothetical protein [Rhodococcus gannanensis]|jgi:hypothetical protein|uniref:Uncharacterized protein n=1 Tax=Rhodococcus gannanensis TaxID=1960308 RepID=A0ABW4NZ12_9NOCA